MTKRALLAAFDLDTSHLALGVARIVFFGAVLGELAELYAWRRLSYLPQHWWVADILLPAHLLVVAAVVLGYRTRFALWLNYPLAYVVLGAARDQYHFDCMIENFSFVFLFAPTPRRLALDAVRLPHEATPVPRWFSVLLFTALELTYADSVYFKLGAKSWTSGSAFWLGAANPPFSTGFLPDALEIPWLMRSCTYLAFAYEALFPLVLVRVARPVIVVTGIFLHLGIGVFYPLPWFGLGVAALVAAFFPQRRRTEVLVPETTSPVARRGVPAAAYALCVILAGAQLALAFHQPRGWVHEATGIYRHPIFYDWHFQLRAPVLAFRAIRDGREVVIPSFDAGGRPEISNRYWTLLGFRLRSSPNPALLVDRYLSGWFTKEGWDAGLVRVYAKDVALASLDLDFGADDRIESGPWRLAGEVYVTPLPLRPVGGVDAPLRLREK